MPIRSAFVSFSYKGMWLFLLSNVGFRFSPPQVPPLLLNHITSLRKGGITVPVENVNTEKGTKSREEPHKIRGK